MRRYRIATFYVLKAHKSLMDYERGTRYFRQNRPTIKEFEPGRRSLRVAISRELGGNADTTSKAVETLASVDPPLAARIDNTIKNILFTFKKDLMALSESEPEKYVKLICNQDPTCRNNTSRFQDRGSESCRTHGKFGKIENALRRFSDNRGGNERLHGHHAGAARTLAESRSKGNSNSIKKWSAN